MLEYSVATKWTGVSNTNNKLNYQILTCLDPLNYHISIKMEQRKSNKKKHSQNVNK